MRVVSFLKKNEYQAIVVFIFILSVVYIFLLIDSLKKTRESLSLSQDKNIEIEGELLSIKGELASANENINSLNDVLTNEQKKVISFERKIEDYSDTISDLEKLTTIPPVLLQKYSKVYFLNEHYEPPELKSIDKKFLFDTNKEAEVDSRIYEFLDDMLQEAEEDEIPLRVVSAYRSFGTQAQLKSSYSFLYGAGTANQFSADQGYSEHQLGTTIDLTIPRLGGLSTEFESTDTYKWLLDNAYKFGFILSYPKGNAYYQFEPWHWRFVGKDLARYLNKKEKNFYDLSQKEIDEYLLELFD